MTDNVFITRYRKRQRRLLLRVTVVWLNCLYNTPYGFVQLIFYVHREENYFKCKKNKNKKYIHLREELFPL